MISTALHSVPLKSGIARLANSQISRWSCQDLESACAHLRNGLNLEVDPQDYNGRMLLLAGTPDPKILEVCLGMLDPGTVFLDIGANYGSIGLMCADVVGPTGEIHFFEPQSELCSTIRRSITTAGLKQCYVHEYALMEQGGDLSLSKVPGHSGVASLVRSSRSSVIEETVTVRAAGPAIADVVREKPFGAKLDVEGSESQVLPAIITQPGFRFVIFECNRSPQRDWAWNFFEHNNLRLFGLCRGLWCTLLEPIADRQTMNRFHDVLAVRSSTKLMDRRIRIA